VAGETFISYWNGEEPTPQCPQLDRMPPYVDVVPLGFVLIDDNWRLDFDTFLCKQHPPAVIQQWVKEVRANGSKVLLSINDEKLGSVPDVGAFVDEVVDAAVAWGVDGVDFDYEEWDEPSDTMIDVVTATRPALAKALGRAPYLSAPVYYRWEFYPEFLGRLAAELDLVMTMDYTGYVGYNPTIELFQVYAAAIGTPEKLAIGVSCMGPAPPQSQNFTPLLDVEKLCHWEPQDGKKGGVMLYTFSYDVETRVGSGTGYPDGTFTRAIEANLP
jgi:hypothetical protein